METLLMMLFVGALAKGTTKAVLGGGKRRKLGCMIIRNSQVLSKNGNE